MCVCVCVCVRERDTQCVCVCVCVCVNCIYIDCICLTLTLCVISQDLYSRRSRPEEQICGVSAPEVSHVDLTAVGSLLHPVVYCVYVFRLTMRKSLFEHLIKRGLQVNM